MNENIKIILLINFFLIFTTYAGNSLRVLFNINIKNNININLCFSFYLGLIFTIISFRIVSEFVNVSYAKYIIPLLLVVIFFINKFSTFSLSKEIIKKFLLYTLILTLFSPLIILYWHPSNNDINDVFSNIGSLHSVKYAWISNYIAICNSIPILGQNTGQSIYVSLLNLMFGNKPFIYLSIILVWAQFFLYLLVFGVFKLYFNNWRSFAYSLLIFFGTSALSFTHILVIDSGSPLIMNGYTDTLIGIFSICIFYYLYNYINSWKFRDYSLYCFLLLANFLSSPQNILYILVINFILIFLNNRTHIKKLLFLNSFAIIVSILGIFLGGMLTPKFLQVEFSGQILQTLFSKSSALGDGLKIIPGIPFYFGSMSTGWFFGNMDLLKAAQNILSDSDLKISNLIWTVESIFFNSVRILAIPLIGIIFLVFRLNYKKFRFSFHDTDYQKFCFITFLLFIFGFIISFFVSFNGYKWEFSRFLIPGYFLSYIAFCLFLEYLVVQGKISIVIFNTIIFLVVFAPLFDFLLTIFNNASYIINNSESLINFFGNGPFIDKSSCLIK